MRRLERSNVPIHTPGSPPLLRSPSDAKNPPKQSLDGEALEGHEGKRESKLVGRLLNHSKQAIRIGFGTGSEEQLICLAVGCSAAAEFDPPES